MFVVQKEFLLLTWEKKLRTINHFTVKNHVVYFKDPAELLSDVFLHFSVFHKKTLLVVNWVKN